MRPRPCGDERLVRAGETPTLKERGEGAGPAKGLFRLLRDQHRQWKHYVADD
jgi:hypothetical protein